MERQPNQQQLQSPPASPLPPPDTALVLFARLPVPGKAKTRLAASVGNEAAARFYELCAQLAFHEACRCAAVRASVYCAAAADARAMHQWLQRAGCPLPVWPQLQEHDLGRRMLAALTHAATAGWAAASGSDGASGGAAQEAFQQQQQQQQQQQLPTQHEQQQQQQRRLPPPPPPAQQEQQQPPQQQAPRQRPRAVLIAGTDIPDLSASVLDAAAAALACHDAVLGCAADGGFYLLGLRSEALLRPDVQAGELFQGVTWSSSSVAAATAANAAALRLRVAPHGTLPVLRDVDTGDDLAAWWHDAAGAGAGGGGCGTPRQELLDCVRGMLAGGGGGGLE